MFSCLFLLACTRTEIESTDNITKENLLEYRNACPTPLIDLTITNNPLSCCCPNILFQYLGTDDPDTECVLLYAEVKIWRDFGVVGMGPFRSFADPQGDIPNNNFGYGRVELGISTQFSGDQTITDDNYYFIGNVRNPNSEFGFVMYNFPDDAQRVWVCIELTLDCGGSVCKSYACIEKDLPCF